MVSDRRLAQQGMTLLEVLIAISIFALIGVASFRVLSGVVDSQVIGDQHSDQLAGYQRALTVIDRDLQQMVMRSVRVGASTQLAPLMVNAGDYPLELTRGGWQNPLQVPRSSMQRVAYRVGPHPLANDKSSRFFEDERQYLLRYYWPALDRGEDLQPVVQALLPDIAELKVAVVSNVGLLGRWPHIDLTGESVKPKAQALQFTLVSEALGEIRRLYPTEFH